jgi:hypothetical protein
MYDDACAVHFYVNANRVVKDFVCLPMGALFEMAKRSFVLGQCTVSPSLATSFLIGDIHSYLLSIGGPLVSRAADSGPIKSIQMVMSPIIMNQSRPKKPLHWDYYYHMN